MNRQRLVFWLFIIVALAHLAGIYIGAGWLQQATKPLLMPLLGVYFLLRASGLPSNAVVATAAALVLSLCGDVLLMRADSERFFMLGLIAFLLAHLFYIYTFGLLREAAIFDVRKGFIYIRVIVLLLAGSAIFYLLYPHLGAMQWPVALYTLVIFAMALTALLRKGHTREKSFIMVYIGALLFILSDTMIALDRFVAPIALSRLLIMGAYISAQLLIVKGILAHSAPEIALD